jgi:uncharacterized damage-inducible protein DinB
MMASALLLVFAQTIPEIGLGWTSEFEHAAKQTIALAEAIPAENYSWRPAPGVRSVSEVLAHIVYSNYRLLDYAGGKIPDDTPPIPADFEKKLTAKADVLRRLKASFDAVRSEYPRTDKTAKRKFLGRDSTSDAVFLRLLVHNHEHMGQMIAYARALGVKPPWSSRD